MGFIDNMHYADVVKNAKHFLAIGQTEVWLRDKSDFPWGEATSLNDGGAWRSDLQVTYNIAAKLKCGVTVMWSLDLEDRDANGSHEFRIDTDAIDEAMRRLPQAVATQLANKLKLAIEATEKRGAEYREAATRQFAMAGMIRNSISKAGAK